MSENLWFHSVLRTLLLLLWLIPCRSVGVPLFVSGNDSLALRYIEKPDTFFVVRASLTNEVDYFEISGDNFRYDVRPNLKIAQKFGLAYRFVAFSFSLHAPVFSENNDDELKGKTKAFALGVQLLGNHWGQSLQVSRTKGYYLENTSDIVPGWAEGEDPYLQFPDQKVQRFSGATTYKFNPRLSLKALNSQTEIQKKSAGSFILVLNYNVMKVDNRSNEPKQTSSQKSVQAGAQLSAGYAHTFVAWQKWYAAAGLTAGLGFNYTDLLTRLPEGNVNSSYTDPVFRLDPMLSLGYNAPRFFFGIQSVGAVASENQNRSGVVISSDRVFGQFFLGYRFNTPAVLKKAVRKAEQMIPFSKP